MWNCFLYDCLIPLIGLRSVFWLNANWLHRRIFIRVAKWIYCLQFVQCEHVSFRSPRVHRLRSNRLFGHKMEIDCSWVTLPLKWNWLYFHSIRVINVFGPSHGNSSVINLKFKIISATKQWFCHPLMPLSSQRECRLSMLISIRVKCAWCALFTYSCDCASYAVNNNEIKFQQ